MLRTDNALENMICCGTIPRRCRGKCDRRCFHCSFSTGIKESLHRTWAGLERLFAARWIMFGEVEWNGEHGTLNDINETIPGERVQLPKIDKFGTGRSREGRYDLSLRIVDREAQCAFGDPARIAKKNSAHPGMTRARCALCKLGTKV